MTIGFCWAWLPEPAIMISAARAPKRDFHLFMCNRFEFTYPPKICKSRRIAIAPREAVPGADSPPLPAAARIIHSVAASHCRRVDKGFRDDEFPHCWSEIFRCN